MRIFKTLKLRVVFAHDELAVYLLHGFQSDGNDNEERRAAYGKPLDTRNALRDIREYRDETKKHRAKKSDAV